MKRIAIVSSFFCFTALAIASCVRDIAEPSVCPPSARPLPPASACPSQRIDDCWTPEVTACKTGRSTCACAANECPESKATCNPPPDCPAVVRERYGPNVRCLTLEDTTTSFSPMVNDDGGTDSGVESDASDLDGALFYPPAPLGCTCGCLECIRRCDGIGVSIAAPAGAAKVAGLQARVSADGLPLEGRLGVYVRARGTYSGVFLVSSSLRDPSRWFSNAFEVEAGGSGGADGFLVIDTRSRDDAPTYEEEIVFKDRPAVWKNSTEKPQYFAVSTFGPLDAVLDIDCIVPFLIP